MVQQSRMPVSSRASPSNSGLHNNKTFPKTGKAGAIKMSTKMKDLPRMTSTSSTSYTNIAPTEGATTDVAEETGETLMEAETADETIASSYYGSDTEAATTLDTSVASSTYMGSMASESRTSARTSATEATTTVYSESKADTTATTLMPTADENVTSTNFGDTTLEGEEEEGEEEEEEEDAEEETEATMTSLNTTARTPEAISTALDVTEEEAEKSRILVVGGVDLESLDPDFPGKVLMTYVPAANRWRSFASLPYYTHHHGAAIVGNDLFIVGKYTKSYF